MAPPQQSIAAKKAPPQSNVSDKCFTNGESVLKSQKPGGIPLAGNRPVVAQEAKIKSSVAKTSNSSVVANESRNPESGGKSLMTGACVNLPLVSGAQGEVKSDKEQDAINT